mgnify:CR=1
MARPCHCDRYRPGESFDPQQDCRLCFLYHNNVFYQQHWDGHAAPTTLPAPAAIEEGPGWFRKLVNFSQASVQHLWHGLPITASAEQERRIAICLNCDYLEQNTGICRHRNCGCKVAVKVGWADQYCPLSKW